MNSTSGMKFNAAFPILNNSLQSLVLNNLDISKRFAFALAVVLVALDLEP